MGDFLGEMVAMMNQTAPTVAVQNCGSPLGEGELTFLILLHCLVFSSPVLR